ncbi:hypothetical protein Btru_056853 [Bulinus truncatus]|nr:hypothetical protein Btru_056853 [Bulinus truncatus]
MADRSCRQKDTFQRPTGTARGHGLGPPRPNPSRVPSVQTAPPQHSPSHEPGQNPSPDSHFPSIALGPQTRDSGYNTDVSPATTSSPATNATSRQHFVFDNLPESGSQHHLTPTAAPLSAFSAPRSPHAHVLDDLCDPRAKKKSMPPLRLSPEIFKISEQRSSFSPRPVSEASDNHGIMFDFEIGGDDENVTERPEDDFGCGQPGRAATSVEASERTGPFVRGCYINENLLYDSEGILTNWGQSPDPTLRCRASSFGAKPRRRHCSTGDDAMMMMMDATRWGDSGAESGTFAQRSYSFSESCSDAGHMESPDFTQPGLQRRSRFSPLAASQGFQYGCYDYSVSRSESCESENVFSFDLDGIEDDEEEEDVSEDGACAFHYHRAPSSGVPIVREKPPHSPASTSRLRRRRTALVASHLHISGGVRLPCSGTIVGVSVATQTPHAASALIQQILSTPVPLPNEAIGVHTVVNKSCEEVHDVVSKSCGEVHDVVSKSCEEVHDVVSKSCEEVHDVVSKSCEDVHDVVNDLSDASTAPPGRRDDIYDTSAKARFCYTVPFDIMCYIIPAYKCVSAPVDISLSELK